jgi:NhaA family Na+:H+ antiporter
MRRGFAAAVEESMSQPLRQSSGEAPRVLRPFLRFAELESSGGIVLLACTVIALLWANSPWAPAYAALWETRITVGSEQLGVSKPLLLWINDGLMAVFFFVVGLEIKREALVGELASLRQAALPILGAIGGMVVPAGIYLAVNWGKPSAQGWGIPMATDIAFALGVLTLLGRAAPVSLKIFLTALAIVDDIGAVLVIAVFYTAELQVQYLIAGVVFLAGLILLNMSGIRRPLAYFLLALALWYVTLKSGVHATIAGVAAAMSIPARARLNPAEFLREGRQLLQHFDDADERGETPLSNEEQYAAVASLEQACERVQTPLQRMETSLHPWVSFFIMPVFALANAGVALTADMTSAVTHPVTIGVALGLLLGKPIGITLMAMLGVAIGLADRPPNTTWRQFLGVGCLGGIGFTMALFIAHLALGADDLVRAKLAVLVASVLSGVLGWLLLRGGGSGSMATADEDEAGARRS